MALSDIRVIEQAVEARLFERLLRNVRGLGDERRDTSYDTTFWFPRDALARNVAEQAILQLCALACPPERWVGAEWWLGRLAPEKRLPFHFDRDLSLSRLAGVYVPPIISSILYLTSVPSSPTVLLGQVAGADGRTRIPPRPAFRKRIDAVANRYVIFPGRLRHGVVPRGRRSANAQDSVRARYEADERLSLLVNYWDRRPHAPICRDYDGKIYRGLALEGRSDPC